MDTNNDLNWEVVPVKDRKATVRNVTRGYVKKVCVSLPTESLAQLDWIRQNVLHAPETASFSGLLQMTIGLAYFKYQNESIKE